METRSMTKQGITPEDMECAHILKDLHKSEVCEFNEYGISILEEERRKYISDYLLLDNMKWQIQILTLANEYGENIEKLRSMIELCHDSLTRETLDNEILTVEKIEILPKLPSLEEIRAKLIGLISSPAQKIASVLTAPSGDLVRVFNAYSTK